MFPIFQLLRHIGVLYRNSCKPKIVFNYFAIKYKPNISMWITIPACLLSHTILYVQIWRAPFTKQTKSHFMVLKNCFLFELQESQHDAFFKAFYIRHISSRILSNVTCKQIQNWENTVFGWIFPHCLFSLFNNSCRPIMYIKTKLLFKIFGLLWDS